MTDEATLTTVRLRMQPFTLHDTADLFSIRGDQEAMKHWDWANDDIPEQTTVIAGNMMCEMLAGKSLYWTARNLNDAFAGVFDLSDLDRNTADLGFMVPRHLWGRGYGLEGAAAIVAEGSRRGLSTLHARIHDGNLRSARLLARLGFAELETSSLLEVRPGKKMLCRHFRRSCPDTSSR